MTNSQETSPKPIPKGIPSDHPSFGRSIRDQIDGPSWPQLTDHGGGRMITPLFEILWGVALAIWILYSRLAFISPYFKDPDAARLAFGVGQRLQGVPYSDGVFHLIEKQIGTYVLFEWLARIFRVDIAQLQDFMSLTCAIMMIGIIALSYHLGYMIWGRRVALVSTTLLSISPMMWITGQYPTSPVPAFFFFMLAVWAMVLSYRLKGGRWWLGASALLFALAILIRLDMILGILVPVCYAWFVDRRGLRRALIQYLIIAVVLLAVWIVLVRIPIAEIFKIDPHQPDYPKSLLLNWWGMGPFLFVFAFAGFVYRFIADRKALPFIFFWIVGFNTFYTGHLYSPRYFIYYYPVVSWLAAFSIIALYSWLVQLVRYNRPLRLLIMALLAFGALTMLTMSTIKEGDGKIRIAWGETITYARDDGLSPTGAVWFYMQDFRRGDGFQYSWLEDGARQVAGELLDPNSDSFAGNPPAIYIGSESQVFLNYFLLATGWEFDRIRGPFLTFTREPLESDTSLPSLLVQTVYVDENPIGELASISSLSHANYLLGRDAIPHFVGNEGEIGTPRLLTVSGWHVAHSYDGLDIIVSEPVGRMSDGTIACERELYKIFHLDPLPHYHIDLTPSEPVAGGHAGIVTSHNGHEISQYQETYLKDVSEITWMATPHSERFLALAIYRMGFPSEYHLSINDQPVNDVEWYATDIPGLHTARWDIILIPPKYFDRPVCEFKLVTDIRRMFFDIYWVQRTYPDCQFRNEFARPLGLPSADYPCTQ